MPTYYWTQIPNTALQNGLTGNSATWASLAKNADFLNVTHSPTYVASRLGDGDGLGAVITGGGTITICHYVVPKHYARNFYEVRILAKVDGGSATRVFANIGGCASGYAGVTATSPTWYSINVRPTSDVHPREGTLTTRLGAGTSTLYIYAMTVARLKTRPDAGGIDAAGCVTMNAEMYAGDAPLSTERVARLTNTPISAVLDRPAGLVSVIDDYTSDARSAYSTTGGTFVPVSRFMLPKSDPQKRTYRISSLWKTTATAMEAKISLGGYFFEYTPSSGSWEHTTVDLALNDALWGSAVCRVSSGSGRAMLKSLQILREV